MNEQTQLAWNIIETTNTNLFLTGKAGTGKTTFLRRLKQESSKRIIVVAPTGIAAINAEGTTIHSFFQLSFAPFIPDAQYKTKEQQYRFSKQKIRVIQSIDTLVIDEISMVRADLLDAVDAVLRRFRKNQLPFGGVQMVMIGDLGQLAPVAKDDEWQLLSRYYATPYFFSSLALQRTRYAIVELKTVYRQNDSAFSTYLIRYATTMPTLRCWLRSTPDTFRDSNLTQTRATYDSLRTTSRRNARTTDSSTCCLARSLLTRLRLRASSPKCCFLPNRRSL